MTESREPSLETRIKSLIQTNGPISISVFMQLALFDRKQGYYATRPGIGRDFITAPEISQVFGELLGVWAAYEWQQLGCPSTFHLIELGPGRGTMIRDIWRATSKIQGFNDAAQVHLIEPSLALRKKQADTLGLELTPEWVDDLADIPDGPTLIIANEVLDCLPIRQFVQKHDKWHERQIGLDDKNCFTFGLSGPINSAKDQALLEELPRNQSIIEISTALDAYIQQISERLAQGNSRVLFIDYGPASSRPADTFRAYANGKQIDPLTQVGKTDLTADVDFTEVSKSAQNHNLDVSGPISQGWFLGSMGGVERINQLMDQNPSLADNIAEGGTKLMSPEHMGERFQAICLSSNDLPKPAGFQ
ncbi:class I SAM-dependent methyltransferase [Hirschia maritima]|uniref:class I SAM-dependent methyltransferase n=1 Tax=Hirschia maritima TaxID=1121961 RepID=UPI0003739799|nr:SAM-dependent methyltransferase [Hirschia maritima]